MARKPTPEMIATYGYSQAAVIMAAREVAAKKAAAAVAKKAAVKKPKAPPIPVLGTWQQTKEQTSEAPLPTRRTATSTPTMMDRKKPGKPHLPHQLEYLSPENFLARTLGARTPLDQRRKIERDQQRQEGERRDTYKAARAARKARRAAVSQLPPELRKAVGRDQLKDFIQNGPKAPGVGLTDIVGGIGKAVLRGTTGAIEDFTGQLSAGLSGRTAGQQREYRPEESTLATVAGHGILGENIVAAVRGDDFDSKWLALELGMIMIPVKGAPSAVTAALRALVGGARLARAEKAGLTVAQVAKEMTRPVLKGSNARRTLRSGDKVQQLPAARSPVTRNLIERPADWTSAKLMSEDSKAAALIRKVFPTGSVLRPGITAEARVSRAAGREQVWEAARAQARLAPFTKALPKADSPEDVAHAYWAQLPSSYRNAEGLKLIVRKQADALAEITTGKALEKIEKRIAAVEGELRSADEAEPFALLDQRQDLKLLAADLPNQVEDISTSIAKLRQVIANPPELDPKVIEAIRELSGDRKAVLTAAGMLDPEKATAREGLLSRWLGLEPTGEEAFLGHRLGKVRGAQPSLMPVSVGTGRVRVPQGVARENKLVLAKTGRMRASTHVAAEDWQAVQVYKQAAVARGDLAAMGAPFTGRVPKGYMLVNPKGRAIPAHWKTDHLSKISETDDDALRKAAEEIQAGFLAQDNAVDEMKAAAEAAGVQWDELRIVPENVVKRYYGQFTPAGRATVGGKAYDAGVDFVAASIVFARVGYIPKNVAQNLIISVPHQGPFMLVNIPRAAQVLRDPELLPLLRAEVGFGPTMDVAEGMHFSRKLRGLPSKAAESVGKIADDPLRISAFLHEVAAEGVISKYSPVLTGNDRAKLLQLLQDKGQRPLLNDIRSRAVESMADFSRLTPQQRRWARRFLIIPGWLWAGSRYPIHFAATHPGRSAALGYVAAGEPYADQVGLPQNPPITEAFQEGLPYGMEGIKTPWGTLRTTSLSPVNTPFDIALALVGGNQETALDYANPLAKSIYNILTKQVPYPGGAYEASYMDAIGASLPRLVPNFKFVKEMVNPDGSGLYPEDEDRLERLLREAGVFPIKIRTEDESDTNEWQVRFEETIGKPIPEDVLAPMLEARRASQMYDEMERKFKNEYGIEAGGLHPQERLAVYMLAQIKLDPENADEWAKAVPGALSRTPAAAERSISGMAGVAEIANKISYYNRIEARLSEMRRASRPSTPSGMVNLGQHAAVGG